MKDYEFGIKRHEELDYEAVVLADDTHLVLGKKEMTLMFPKKKFKKIFQDQIDDKSKAFIGVTFTMMEINAMMKGLGELAK